MKMDNTQKHDEFLNIARAKEMSLTQYIRESILEEKIAQTRNFEPLGNGARYTVNHAYDEDPERRFYEAVLDWDEAEVELKAQGILK